MRFLFTCIPAFGHVHAMVPYAQALKNQGHEVAFATGGGFSQAIRSAGFNHYPCGIENASSFETLTRLPEWEEIKTRFSAAPPGTAQLHAFVEVLAPRMLVDLPEVIETWRPHLIVRDPLEFGGYIAAERARLPLVLIDWATHIPAHRLAHLALNNLRLLSGLSFDQTLETLDGQLVLSAMPHSWKYENLSQPDNLSRHRCFPYDNAANFDDLVPSIIHADCPVVYATLGTTFNQSPDTFRIIIEALAAEPIKGIVTVGHGFDPATLGVIPGNVLVARYIPQSLVLPKCDAVLFHGGFNSLHSALWHGLPMLLVPMGAGDQMPNAMRAAAMGLGIVEQQPLTVDKLRQALRTVLTDRHLRRNAVRVRAEMLALPPLSEAIYRMEELAGEVRLNAPSGIFKRI